MVAMPACKRNPGSLHGAADNLKSHSEGEYCLISLNHFLHVKLFPGKDEGNSCTLRLIEFYHKKIPCIKELEADSLGAGGS